MAPATTPRRCPPPAPRTWERRAAVPRPGPHGHCRPRWSRSAPHGSASPSARSEARATDVRCCLAVAGP
ncbi:hypothetical protein Pd630_LPD02427 [Rhodococcus opacus PD630]|nr:hypothetical protein Pd630_LPD02427 [Rhodococcus opacus PD630]